MNIPNEAVERAASVLHDHVGIDECWHGAIEDGARKALATVTPLIVADAVEEAGSWCCDKDYAFLRDLAAELRQEAEE